MRRAAPLSGAALPLSEPHRGPATLPGWLPTLRRGPLERRSRSRFPVAAEDNETLDHLLSDVERNESYLASLSQSRKGRHMPLTRPRRAGGPDLAARRADTSQGADLESCPAGPAARPNEGADDLDRGSLAARAGPTARWTDVRRDRWPDPGGEPGRSGGPVQGAGSAQRGGAAHGRRAWFHRPRPGRHDDRRRSRRGPLHPGSQS